MKSEMGKAWRLSGNGIGFSCATVSDWKGRGLLYSEEIIEEVRIRNDIVGVVSGYVHLERRGRHLMGLCPFHGEKTPSFSVDPTKQLFYCFGCQRGGNVFHFLMGIENLDFPDALRQLADRANIQLPESEDEGERERARLKKDIMNLNREAARFFLRLSGGAAGEGSPSSISFGAVWQKRPFAHLDWASRQMPGTGLSARCVRRGSMMHSSSRPGCASKAAMVPSIDSGIGSCFPFLTSAATSSRLAAG